MEQSRSVNVGVRHAHVQVPDDDLLPSNDIPLIRFGMVRSLYTYATSFRIPHPIQPTAFKTSVGDLQVEEIVPKESSDDRWAKVILTPLMTGRKEMLIIAPSTLNGYPPLKFKVGWTALSQLSGKPMLRRDVYQVTCPSEPYSDAESS